MKDSIEQAIDSLLENEEGEEVVDLSKFEPDSDVFALVGVQDRGGNDVDFDGFTSISELEPIINKVFRGYFPFGNAPAEMDPGVFTVETDDGHYALFGKDANSVIKYNQSFV